MNVATLESDRSGFHGVCEAYKKACCKTLYYHEKLKMGVPPTEITLRINSAETREFVEEYKVKV